MARFWDASSIQHAKALGSFRAKTAADKRANRDAGFNPQRNTRLKVYFWRRDADGWI
jgi:hypothetical protein